MKKLDIVFLRFSIAIIFKRDMPKEWYEVDDDPYNPMLMPPNIMELLVRREGLRQHNITEVFNCYTDVSVRKIVK